MKYDVVVIGAGPAGISSAIYTARSKLKTLIIGKILESKLSMSHKIHNYFGFKEGIEGSMLLRNGIEQAKKVKAQIIDGEIVDVKRKNKEFELKDAKNKKYQTKAIILAMGSKTDALGIKKEKELINRGVHYCAICDGPLYKNKSICIIGNGNHAAEEAIELRAYSKDIMLVSQKGRFNISKELTREIKKQKIKMIEGEIVEFSGKNKLEKVIMKDKEVKCDAAFIAPGTASSASIARKLGIEIRDNRIVVNEKGETDLQGVFAAGESTGNNKQIAICVGEGCNAALSAIKYLRGRNMYVDYA
ncbi:MAG: FAD-dependent oxidoreductase [archaeon]